MARKIELQDVKKITHTTQQAVEIETDSISVDTVIDDGKSVVAKISFYHSSGLTKDIILWEKEEYEAIGNWTDEDVDARIKQLLKV